MAFVSTCAEFSLSFQLFVDFIASKYQRIATFAHLISITLHISSHLLHYVPPSLFHYSPLVEMVKEPASPSKMSYYTGPTTFFERMKMNSKNGADTTPPIDKGDLKASKSSVSLRPAVQEFAPGRNHGEDDSASRSRLHSHPSVKLSENIQPVVQVRLVSS